MLMDQSEGRKLALLKRKIMNGCFLFVVTQPAKAMPDKDSKYFIPTSPSIAVFAITSPPSFVRIALTIFLSQMFVKYFFESFFGSEIAFVHENYALIHSNNTMQASFIA